MKKCVREAGENDRERLALLSDSLASEQLDDIVILTVKIC